MPSGNCPDCNVYDKDGVVGHFSYNGRLWKGEVGPWDKDKEEIKIEVPESATK